MKQKVEECKPDDINHERTHQIQQIECSIVGLVLGIILWLSFSISFWWVVALTFGFFYLWYIIEYLIIMCFAKWDKHYENIVKYHRQRTTQLGYHEPEFIWKQQAYEEARRNMLNGDILLASMTEIRSFIR